YNSSFFSDKLVVTSGTPASSVPVLQTPKDTSSIFFFQAEDGIRDGHVTGVQTCALPISLPMRVVNFSARSPASPGRKSRPRSSFPISSGVPPTCDPTAQQPQAIASSSVLEKACEREHSTKISRARRY